jgi:anti-sigma B factor antagonist
MEIIETQENQFVIITVKGRIDSNTAPQFLEALKSITTRDIFTIILDLHDVVYISSAGLRVLIDILKTCKRSNTGDLILVNVPQRINETLELAGFAPLFRFSPDVQTAIEQYKA